MIHLNENRVDRVVVGGGDFMPIDDNSPLGQKAQLLTRTGVACIGRVERSPDYLGWYPLANVSEKMKELIAGNASVSG
jgi:hypothetical protein